MAFIAFGVLIAGVVVSKARRQASRAKPASTVVAAVPERERPKGTTQVLPENPDEIRKLLSNPTNPVVKISTGKGDMLVELYEDKVPNTTANLIELAEKGFYKGLAFHRVIPDFMAQGGCPYSRQGAGGKPGTGDPGYRFADEFGPGLKHTGRGLLSMANSGVDTNGSQFFLLFAAANFLDGKHSVFGNVVAGIEVLDRLEAVGSLSGEPSGTVRFNVEVVLKKDHPYTVKRL
ncbi:MAG: peptidylprolyl isomerase [Lentisphaeria bacterium]|nr:peptidylprolyl isomerase [Lentisphaeria bacterium]